jgi:hypothetical protein
MTRPLRKKYACHITSRNPGFEDQGFVKGYTVVSEQELEGGKIEIILELPLTGGSGLSRSIAEASL